MVILKRIKKVLLYIMLGAVAVIQIYPVIWMILISFKDNNEIFSGNIMGLPKKLLWENYVVAIRDAKVAVFFFNSVKVSAITLFVTICLSLTVAYAITRMGWKHSKTVLTFFLVGIMIPGQAIIMPIYELASRTHLLNTHFLLICVYTVFALPTSVYILSSFMSGLPRELEESAFIDGASIYRTFFSIIIPIIRPAIVSVLILNFIGVWNEFMFGFVLINTESLRTIPVGIQSLVGQYNTNWGPMGAAMVVATIPTIIIYTIFSGQIQNSLIVGSVKG
jgi:raffinose/stachyose/melibiose transport system permease protein